ncbi:hypothetical protein ElyMa_000465900 [Elysia marginata]|uniref:Uncharacterized protein n=1 Tax=Elysia marginata TaxID=1093978 RepID=A0AAV4FSX5_9GAST|nr:hypothetical protein ElyMa_000465900 [Elysia marginata]
MLARPLSTAAAKSTLYFTCAQSLDNRKHVFLSLTINKKSPCLTQARGHPDTAALDHSPPSQAMVRPASGAVIVWSQTEVIVSSGVKNRPIWVISSDRSKHPPKLTITQGASHPRLIVSGKPSVIEAGNLLV